jgi:hypothetical protein
VKVDLCAEAEHPHTGNIKIIYHWPEDGNEHPDSMLVLANRIINTRRVGYITGKETSIGGRYRFGKTYGGDEVIDENSLVVGAGEYQIFAFNHDIVDTDRKSGGMEGNPDYRVESIDEYGSEQHYSSVGIRDIGISYVGRSLDDPHLNRYNKDWIEEFNDYARYIATDIKPIYRAINYHDEASQEYTVSVHANEEIEVDLYPQKVTQDIAISFPIYTDEEVMVDSIIAEISGIPRKMMVYTGVIVADTTYKMLFPVKIDQANTKKVALEVEENGKVVKRTFVQTECMGDISVIGLIANQNPNHRTGAGILVLCIYSKTINEIGEVKTKAQYAKINLYNTIKRSNLLIKNEQGEIMQNPGTDPDKSCTNTLRIDDSQLILTRNLILQTSDNDVLGDSWEKAANGDIDIDA